VKIGDVHHIKILAWQGERQARSDAGKPGVSRPVHSKKCPAMLSLDYQLGNSIVEHSFHCLSGGEISCTSLSISIFDASLKLFDIFFSILCDSFFISILVS